MIDKKRRKAYDNPYTIKFIEEKGIYSINFKNNVDLYNMQISSNLYKLFDTFELEDISYMNKYDRHIEHLQLDEIQLYKRASNKVENIEEKVIKNIETQRLYEAINKLPKIQRNRIYSYYFKNMTQKEIAMQDNCSIRAVQYSLDIALKSLRNFLE